MTMAQCEAHRDTCTMVSLQARRVSASLCCIRFVTLQAGRRRHSLSLFYDELARKRWAERANAGDPSFVVQLSAKTAFPHCMSFCAAC